MRKQWTTDRGLFAPVYCLALIDGHEKLMIDIDGGSPLHGCMMNLDRRQALEIAEQLKHWAETGHLKER